MMSGALSRAAGLALVLALPACGREPCVEDGIDEGDKVRITIVDLWNRESQFLWDVEQLEPPSCDPNPDLPPGTSFVVRAEEMEINGPAGCLVARGVPSDLAGVEFLGATDQGGFSRIGSPFLDVKWRAQIGPSCQGIWTLSLAKFGEGNPFDEPVPGQLPTSNLMRTFMADDPVACRTVGVRWACAYVVRLERIR